MNNKGGAYLTVIGHSITLDEILEANYVGKWCLLGESYLILIAWDSAFLGDLQTPPIAGHDEGVASPEDLGREPLVNLLLQQRSNVHWLSNKRTFLRSRSLLFFEGKDNLWVAVLQHFHSLLEMTCPFRGQR